MSGVKTHFEDACEPISLANCAVGTHYVNPCNCAGYLRCVPGYDVISKNCGAGSGWNQNTLTCMGQREIVLEGICKWEEPWLRCDISGKRMAVVAEMCGGTYEPGPTTEPASTPDPIFRNLCEPLDLRTCNNGTSHVDPCSCDSYYTCGEGQKIYKKTCPPETSWHHQNNTCINKDIVDSGNICSRQKPWERCQVTAQKLPDIAKRCGYTAPNVTPAPSSDNTGAIVGAVVGVILVIAVVLGAIYFMKKRKAKKSKGKQGVDNMEYFENRDSIYNTINEDMHDPTYNADSTLPAGSTLQSQWNKSGFQRSSDGPPKNHAPPVPSIHGLEREAVEYDNPGNVSQSRNDSVLDSEENLSAPDVDLTGVDRYLQLSETYKSGYDLETVKDAEYLEPGNTIRPNSATRDEHL